jgi:hypothetical protein
MTALGSPRRLTATALRALVRHPARRRCPEWLRVASRRYSPMTKCRWIGLSQLSRRRSAAFTDSRGCPVGHAKRAHELVLSRLPSPAGVRLRILPPCSPLPVWHFNHARGAPLRPFGPSVQPAGRRRVLGCVTSSHQSKESKSEHRQLHLHELLHLRVPNHGGLFRALLNAYLYREPAREAGSVQRDIAEGHTCCATLRHRRLRSAICAQRVP